VPDPIVFVGGVEVSYACLEALCEIGQTPALAIGYDDSRAEAAGFADFGTLAERFAFDLVRTGDVNNAGLVEQIERLQPLLIYVIGWSQILRPQLLAAAGHGCVGIHPTKLPEGRGRAPIPWTILKRLDRTASTMFFLSEGIDDGDVIDQIEFEVEPREDAATLYGKHLAAHVDLIRKYAARLALGSAPRTPQNDRLATVWPRRTPQDGRIDWSQSADEIDRLVRAVTRPYPGAFTDTPEGRITIWRGELAPSLHEPPGRWTRRETDVLVACGEGSLRVLEADGPLQAAVG
jgi:methionyl-tRNA formyltransferase